MHEKLGWLFALPQEDSVWLWQDKLGWLWTAADIYPYLYRMQRMVGSSSMVARPSFYFSSLRRNSLDSDFETIESLFAVVMKDRRIPPSGIF